MSRNVVADAGDGVVLVMRVVLLLVIGVVLVVECQRLV